MCGRFTIRSRQDSILERFQAETEEKLLQVYNAAPTMSLPVIVCDEPKKIRFFRWGLIPVWAKNKEIGNRMINARAETLFEKPAFKSIVRSRRCLIIADGFYEWQSTDAGKQPFFFSLNHDELFAFSGLWDVWKPSGGTPLCSFTIITTEANNLVSNIHHRMPVILEREFEKTWLDTSLPDEKIKEMLKPYPAADMKMYPVSKAVNSVRNNSPELILPYL